MFRMDWMMRLCFLSALFLTLPIMADEKPAQSPLKTYQKKCSFCHIPKKAQTLTDMKAWNHLLYTSACPQVSLSLTESERKLIKLHLEQSFKESAKNNSDRPSDRSDNK